jgi:hypothetical protein
MLERVSRFLRMIAYYPLPLRILILKSLSAWLRKRPYSIQLREREMMDGVIAIDADEQRRLRFDLRPYYGHCMLQAARLARQLGYPRLSAIEFGVAGGNGLLHMEREAELITAEVGVEFELYGFDMERGLPRSDDPRDQLYLFREGFYVMDRPALEARLRRAKLVIGDVTETAKTFFEKYQPPPLGAVVFDLDYYSSTKSALAIFDGDPSNYLPRIHCYFDDVLGTNEFVGALRAIKEFNDGHEHQKIAEMFGFDFTRPPASWRKQIFLYHDFAHPKYNDWIPYKEQQIPLVM